MSGESAKPRLNLLDALRGLCVISMVCYHGMFDYVNIFSNSADWFQSWQGYVWQQSICRTFIFLSGFCWGFSRRHLKRGILLLLCGAAVSLVTRVAMPQETVRWGVLTLLGLSAIALHFLDVLRERLNLKIPAAAGLAVSAALFFLTRGVYLGYLGFEGVKLFSLPEALYQFDFLAVLGFPPSDFTSGDYFPLMPWFFLYLAGHFTQRLLKNNRRAESFLSRTPPLAKPFAFVGRHSLIIYLAHQPILMALFLLAF